MKWQLKYLFAATVCALPRPSHAEFVFSAIGGLGFWSQENAAGDLRGESPLSLKFSFEVPLSKSSAFGVEYARVVGINPFTSGIGVANMSYRFYPLGGQHHHSGSSERASLVETWSEGFAPYILGGLGMGHGSTSNHSNLVLAGLLGGGVDCAFGAPVDLRLEVNMGYGFGAGRIYLFNTLLGLVFRYY